MPTPDTITQIDEALHAIRARLRALEASGGGIGGGSGSTMRLSDDLPLKNSGSGSEGDMNAGARGNHVHPAVRWDDILEKPIVEPITGADKTYRHVQITASDVWVVAHNLGKYVSVDVIDTSGALMIGELHYTSLNQIVLSFSAAIAGEAYCN
jgi:hypothetical protein